LVAVNLESREGGPASSGNKTGDIGDGCGISSVGSVLFTARSVPSSTDIGNRVSVGIKAEFFGGVVDISGKCGDQINVINIGEVKADGIVDSLGANVSLNPNNLINDIVGDRNLGLVDSNLDNLRSSEIDAVLNINAFIDPRKRDLIVSIGGIFKSVVAFRERKVSGVGGCVSFSGVES